MAEVSEMIGSQNVHYDQFLTDVAIGYENEGMIARDICNIIPVGKQSGKYRVYLRDHMKVRGDLRAPKTAPNIVTWGYSKDTYYSEEHALRALISPEELGNADSDLDLFSDATLTLRGNLEVNLEVAVASWFQNAALFPVANVIVPAIMWDQAGCTIATDIFNARQACKDSCGKYPTDAIMSQATYERIRANDYWMDLFEHVSGGLVSDAQIMNILNVQKLHIGKGTKNTAKDGQEDVLENIWEDDSIVFFYKSQNLRSKTSLSTLGLFMWNAPHRPGTEISVIRFWDQNLYCHVIDAGFYWDKKILAPDENGLMATGSIITPLWTAAS